MGTATESSSPAWAGFGALHGQKKARQLQQQLGGQIEGAGKRVGRSTPKISVEWGGSGRLGRAYFKLIGSPRLTLVTVAHDNRWAAA
jgi:hypothetical protein